MWYQWIMLAALLLCLGSCVYHLYRIISMGAAPEYARKAGNTAMAVRYSFTGAMNPKNKESASLHLPTYTAGLIFHAGTFLSILLFFVFLFDINPGMALLRVFAFFLALSGFSGILILLKRMAKSELRSLSNPDDYISNILVTAFQLITALLIFYPQLYPAYCISATMLLLYFPLGKLKHALYFFAARYHLGLFYGWRGVWPPKPISK
jgi:hypothetical protein